MPRKRRRKRFSKSFGNYGNRIRVGQRATGTFFAEWKDPVKGTYRRKTLGREQGVAVQWAEDEIARRQLKLSSASEHRAPVPTVARVFAAYLTIHCPFKGQDDGPPTAATIHHDERCSELWTRFLGAQFDVRDLDEDEHWKRFIYLRKSGAIDAHGLRVDTRRPVRNRTVERDCLWLKDVFRWATTRKEHKRRLLETNPCQTFHAPVEPNPQQVVCSETRYRKLLDAATRHHMTVMWSGKRRCVRSYLRELLVTHNGTGRRNRAVRHLRRDDLMRNDDGGIVGIQWPATSDKQRKQWYAVVSPAVADAITSALRLQTDLGAVSPYVFPAPRHLRTPIDQRLAARWLAWAELEAKVSHEPHGGWHTLRRKWASERRGHPIEDVAAGGGWSDTQSLRKSYLKADDASVERVILEPTHTVTGAVGQE